RERGRDGDSRGRRNGLTGPYGRSHGTDRLHRRTTARLHRAVSAALPAHDRRARAARVHQCRSGRVGTRDVSQHVWLVRHAQTDANAEGRYVGSSDVDLDEAGLDQARQLATWSARTGLDLIVSSPARRAWRTASVVGTQLGIQPRLDERLRELDFGI